MAGGAQRWPVRRPVAVKLLNTALIGGAGLARFKREGSILARLQHPHIAHLLDAGGGDGQPYLVLELVEGEPIDGYCTRCGSASSAPRLFLDVLARSSMPTRISWCTATSSRRTCWSPLTARSSCSTSASPSCSSRGRRTRGRALTREGARVDAGVRRARAGEGGPITTATDVYALGVMLYELLGGRHPTGGDHGSAAQSGHARHRPARLSDLAPTAPVLRCRHRAHRRRPWHVGRRRRQALRGDLDNILARALSKPAAERYPSVAALADDLRRYLAHEPVAARPASLAYRSAKFVRRHRLH